MQIEIKHCNGTALYVAQVADDDQYPIRTALERAVAAGVDLSTANLADANLVGANLHGAFLINANLSNTNLHNADLADVNLTDANLVGANLTNANLASTDLSGANLASANLFGANLVGANLANANLSAANLRAAYFCGADLSGIKYEGVPVVPKLDAQILERIESGQGELDMGNWHTCETAHCRAGWAVTLAGEAGRALEAKIGTAAAGALIYHRSTGRIPDFYASDEDALADIVACAREQEGTR
jgi:uncharacterized protein YjbI with pentapeptide repeats